MPDLKGWITYWKKLVSKKYPTVKGLWQNDFWDTQMRSPKHFQRKIAYIENNPVRKELVDSSGKWPFQGDINEFRM
jgi:REP element-mobilizing transposase RayT